MWNEIRLDFLQKVNYMEMFAPIVKMNSIRVLLSIAANLDCPIH